MNGKEFRKYIISMGFYKDYDSKRTLMSDYVYYNNKEYFINIYFDSYSLSKNYKMIFVGEFDKTECLLKIDRSFKLKKILLNENL